jgi:DNA-binding transcriptional LysR family regulator
LLTERNVTRAARRLHLSQPSVSIQLRRLREIFADPLLSSGPGGMLPTTRAQELLEPVRAVLNDVRRMVQRQQEFDPGTAQTTWQLSAFDYAEMAVLLPLLRRLRKSAPGSRVSVREASHSRMTKLLESGAIDVGFMAIDSPPERLRHRVLFKEHYVLVARKDHPALKRKLTVRTLSELEYAVVSPEGGGFRGITDSALESFGRSRKVVLSVPHFLFIPEVLARTDLVAMLPSRLARPRAGTLQVLNPPLPIPPYDMAMVWHERTHSEPAHSWLRQQIIEAV